MWNINNLNNTSRATFDLLVMDGNNKKEKIKGEYDKGIITKEDYNNKIGELHDLIQLKLKKILINESNYQ